jgi:hypothetical protein
MERDEIVTLPSGTEISVEAALGDLARTREFLAAEYDRSLGTAEEANALVADIEHVRELLVLLANHPDAAFKTSVVAALHAPLRRVQRARSGDSNDEEIEALEEALGLALAKLGVQEPEWPEEGDTEGFDVYLYAEASDDAVAEGATKLERAYPSLDEAMQRADSAVASGEYARAIVGEGERVREHYDTGPKRPDDPEESTPASDVATMGVERLLDHVAEAAYYAAREALKAVDIETLQSLVAYEVDANDIVTDAAQDEIEHRGTS